MILKEISRGITHIEDLSVADFIETLTNISEYRITEKVDGSQILFGLDNKGFYTSRETKGGKRIYTVEDYPKEFSTTYMRSAHIILEQCLPLLKSAGLRPGDQVEAEVLYGQIPNVVPYSADTNYLIFLRTTEGTVNIDRLKQKLDGQAVSVSLVSPFTDDGKSIVLREVTNTWKFARVPVINKRCDEALISRCLTEMKRYLSTKDSFTMQPFGVVLETSLNKIPDWVPSGTWKITKEYLKERREEIRNELHNKYILPLKDVLLNNLVRETASSFGPSVEEGGWIEGVVLQHKHSPKMVKIVDKNTFGIMRESAWKKRNQLTEWARGVDDIPSFSAELYVGLARAIGHPEIGTTQAKAYLRKLGSTNEERLAKLVENINVSAVREYSLSFIETKRLQLLEDLDKYEKEIINEGRTCKSGSTPPGVHQRTMQAYAGLLQDLLSLKESYHAGKTADVLALILAEKHLREL